ncbi:uracil-DNA glycosylase [Desulfofustis limnaeus]|nr:uracil-DNA glycosylase [Desulfofustis limnaeus]MDX9896557.1 uracil-DNA glycosylase [Desulfofustis sp.]
MAQLTEEVASCRMCQLHTQRICPVVGDGGRQPRLLIVGEWPIVPSAATRPETLFGVEEDLMVERMKTALGLSPDHVYVTSLIKCGVPAAVRPSLEQAKTCSRYVRRQVELLQPEVVCAMGTFAAQVLTGIDRPLSMLRGRVLPGGLGDESQLVVVPTYHPTFLLQNPDMKSAAWQDLQLVMKKLGLQHRNA